MSNTDNTSIVITIPEKDSLPPSLLSNIEQGFKAAFEQAEKWRQQALTIKVTSLDQKAEMQLARTIRLELKNTRVAAEKKRKELKADALMMGRAIDGVYNLLEAAIAPLERHLDEQEKFAERLAEAERQRIKAEREAAIAPYLAEGQIVPALDVMTAESFASFLADAKLLHEAKIEAAKKAEAERLAREQAEAAERERMRIENARLLKEVAEREAAAKAEREAAAAKLKAEQAKAAAVLAEQQRIAAKAAQEAAAKARQEREAMEAKAKAERQAAEKQLAAERAERERLEKIAAQKAAAELAAAQAEIAARQAAEAAPDKERLARLASDIRALNVPSFTSKKAITLTDQIKQAIEELAVRVETASLKL